MDFFKNLKEKFSTNPEQQQKEIKEKIAQLEKEKEYLKDVEKLERLSKEVDTLKKKANKANSLNNTLDWIYDVGERVTKRKTELF